jgi:hypothetical protein
MQKYGDSNPSVVREGFQAGSSTSATTANQTMPATIGDLLKGEWYKGQYDALQKKQVQEYTDALMPTPFPLTLLTDQTDIKISTFVYMTHIILASVAVYFSIRASCGFNPKQFAAALLCPYLYLPYYMSLYGFSKVCGANINLKKNQQRLEEAD